MSGRYQIGPAFREGAQAKLSHAFDRLYKTDCLIKVGPSATVEAVLALELNHPYIAQPIDAGCDGELGTYAVYPRFSAPSLLAWRKQNKNSDLRRVALQITDFLCFLHSRGFLYHDFKPEHFLVEPDRLHVIDLGLIETIPQSSTSSTFSGTFPYVAPERLVGRLVDARSDIFAFGMLLLHAFYPDENWSEAPSLRALEEKQKLVRGLTGAWGKILGEMTAFEPGQRIGSAAELWNTLQAGGKSKSFWFCPPRSSFELSTALHQAKVTVIRSSSDMTLVEAARNAQLIAWRNNCRYFSFDLKHSSVAESFSSIAEVLLQCAPAIRSFYTSIESLKNLAVTDSIFISFLSVDALSSKDQTQLRFAVSSLCRTEWAHFLLFEKESTGAGLDDDWQVLYLPLLDVNDLRQWQDQFRSLPGFPAKLAKLPAQKDVLPEHFLAKLTALLPAGQKDIWPAAAAFTRVASVEALSHTQKKILLLLAVADGRLNTDEMQKAIGISGNFAENIRYLQRTGYVHVHNGTVALSIQKDDLLGRRRKMQIRVFAKKVLASWGSEGSPLSTYHVARFAGDLRKAASCAIRLAASFSETSAKMEWHWNAFTCNARLSKRTLQKLARYQMKQGKMAEAAKILKYLGSRYPKSFVVLDLRVEYFRRLHRFLVAEKLATRGIELSQKESNDLTRHYFTARLAGLMIFEQKLKEGEQLLEELRHQTQNVTPNTRGMVHHFSALALYYRGKMDESLVELRKSLLIPHSLRASSIMNIGVIYLTRGLHQQAETWLNRATRIFSRSDDVERLMHALNNMGIVYKATGRITQARQNYYRIVHLGRLCKNPNMIAHSLTNLAVTFEVEGRTDKAIYYHAKGAALARKRRWPWHLGTTLTNLGLQHAIQGHFGKAVTCLKEAIELRRGQGIPLNLACSYEYLGLTHLLSSRSRLAFRYLQTAARFFSESSCPVDEFRCRLYMQLSEMLQGRSPSIAQIPTPRLAANSFESALLSYTAAAVELTEERLNKSECRVHLQEAERIFRKLPSLYWLAKTHLLKMDYFLKTDHQEKGALSLQSATHIFSRLKAGRELLNVKKWEKLLMSVDYLEKMMQKLPYKILLSIREILSLSKPESIIEKLLATSLEFSDMDRAVLILLEDPPRIYKSTTVEEADVKEIFEISRSAVEKVSLQGTPFVCLDATADENCREKKSIIDNQILSIVCLPLKTADHITGVLYLDSKEGVESLASTETLLLEIFSSIAGLALHNIRALEQSIAENRYLRSVTFHAQAPPILGKSRAIQRIFQAVERFVDNRLPVLITGETGTGKELVARVLHYRSSRKNAPFVAVNCSAFSKDLLESELFGHEKGAFTGAISKRTGLFDEARDGTLFLDEIGEMPFSMQAKLLRVLQDGEYRRVGGSQTLHSNARIVLATNRDIASMVHSREFREDLFYRIQGIQIHIPPLQERVEDIPVLAQDFLKQAALVAHKRLIGFLPEAMEVLTSYHWPGNVRQLKLEIERIVAFTDKERITLEDLHPQILESVNLKRNFSYGTAADSLYDIEKHVILERLQQNDWNVLQTAKSLGLSRHGLYSKMKRYQIPTTRSQV